MRALTGFLFGCALVCGSTNAFAGPCSAQQGSVLGADVGEALSLARKAFASLPQNAAGASGPYTRLFGAFDTARNNFVKSVFSQTIASLVVGDVKFECLSNNQQFCAGSNNPLAGVFAASPYKIMICARYFSGADKERASLIVHEVSHYLINGGTDDYCDSESTCAALAMTNPAKVVKAAEAYRLYTYLLP